MIRKGASVLAGLGLIGGAGSVIYNNHGDATVKIKDGLGHVSTVQIKAVPGSKAFSCPADASSKLDAYNIKAAKIELWLRTTRNVERAIEKKYPAGLRATDLDAPLYKAMRTRENKLVDAYNVQIDAHNALLRSDCTSK